MIVVKCGGYGFARCSTCHCLCWRVDTHYLERFLSEVLLNQVRISQITLFYPEI